MVDNVTFRRARELAARLEALEGVPAEFTAFRLILRADGRVVQTIPFSFGQRLSRIELHCG